MGVQLMHQVLAFYAPYATQFAAAYYEPEERKIHVLEDTKDTWTWDLATLRKLRLSVSKQS